MDYRKFEISLISANGLENVRKLFRMKVYAKVSIAGDPETERQTTVDKHGETNPALNFTAAYFIDDCFVKEEGIMVVIKLYCRRTFGDRYIGEVHVSIKELYDYARRWDSRRRKRKSYYMRGGSAVVSLPVQKGSAISMGELKFSYRFGSKVTFEQPSFWEKLLPGAAMCLNVILVSTLGATIPVQIPFFL